MIARLVPLAFAMALATSLSCSNGSPSPAVTAVPTSTLRQGTVDPAGPELENMLAHTNALSVEIGPRLAGSPAEGLAIDYLVGQLESWGYDVAIEAFTAEPEPRPGSGTLRYATFTINSPEALELDAVTFAGAPAGVVRGRLVDAGTAGQVSPDVEGAVALIQRGVHRAAEAFQAGAIAVVIANNEPGFFPGIIEPPIDVPAVGITSEDGAQLRDTLEQSDVQVTLNVRANVTAHNVVARPPSGVCRTISGAHFDSVPWAPGANDNASGTAVVLELARVMASDDLSDLCFVLFGAEELGLLGSEFFVDTLQEDDRSVLEAVYNFDVAASDPAVELIGDRELIATGLMAAGEVGIDASRATLPEGASSDHASFIGAGIPALMLTTPNLDFIHTPQDTIDTIVDEALLDIATLGIELLRPAE